MVSHTRVKGGRFLPCAAGLALLLAASGANACLPAADSVFECFEFNPPIPPTELREGTREWVEVRLRQAPPAVVSVDVAASGYDIAFHPSHLEFGPDNWSNFERVILDVAHDADGVDSRATIEIRVSVGEAQVGTFPMDILVKDDDLPGIDLSNSTLSVVRGRTDARYDVELTVPPSGDVSVELSVESAPPGLVVLNPSTLTFTPADWNVGRTVLVSVPDGPVETPAATLTIRHRASGAEYEGARAALSLQVFDPPEPPGSPGPVALSPLPDGFLAGWQTVAGAVGYRVEYIPAHLTEFVEHYEPRPSDVAIGAHTSSLAVTGLEPGDAYRVRVVAFSEAPDAQAPAGQGSSFGAPAYAPDFVVVGGARPADAALEKITDAALAQYSRASGWSSLEAVSKRFSRDWEPVSHARGVPSGSIFSLGEDTTIFSVHEPAHRRGSDAPTTPGRATGLEVLLPGGRYFSAPEERGKWAIWGLVNQGGLDGRSGGVDLEGSITSLHLGAERDLDPPVAFDRFAKATSREGKWLAGFGGAYSSGSFEAMPDAPEMSQASWLVYPYVGYRDERKTFYATMGGGLGSMSIGSDPESGLLHAFLGTGASFVVTGRPDRVQALVNAGALGSILNRDGDNLLPSSTVLAHRARLGGELKHSREWLGGILSPVFGAGIRYDAGEGPAGYAVDVEVGTRFDWAAYSFSAALTGLVKSGEEVGRNLNASLGLRYSGSPSGRGLTLQIGPVLAVPAASLARDPLGVRAVVPRQVVAGLTWRGYLVPLATPFSAFSELTRPERSAASSLRAGVSVEPLHGAEIGIVGRRELSGDPGSGQAVLTLFLRSDI